MMKKMLAAFAVLALASAGQAWAQARDYISELDANHDGVIQRAEMDAMQADHFNHQDADQDGQLTETESHSGHAASREQYQAHALALFDSVDADHDGALTGDEISAFRSAVSARQAPAEHGGH